jgi:hypothetical protein
MSRLVRVCFAWLVVLTLIFTPLAGLAPSVGAQSTDDQIETPVDPLAETPEATPADPVVTEEPAVTETVAEPTATETATDLPTETATEEPAVTETATDAPPATEKPTEAATTPAATATPKATKTPKAASTPATDTGTYTSAAVTDLEITLTCTGDPETIRVKNIGAADILLKGIATYLDPLAVEPFSISRNLKPGQTALFQSGHNAQYGTVLTTSFLFSDKGYDAEGVRISTSVGKATKMCPPRPAPPAGQLSDLKVTLDCLSTAETIRVQNNGTGWITLKGLATYVDPIADEPFTITRVLKPGQTAIYQAGEGAKYGTILTKQYIFTNAAYEKDGVRISTDVGKLFKACPAKPVPPEKWIEINLTTQFLRAWVGNTLANSTYVSTGKDGFWTPTGTFRILTRYYTQTMSGCLQGECYYVPDVPFVQYFTNYGHALHGAYWHNQFGIARRSHGCVNLPVPFAEWLWYWATYGTRVWIHY